MRIQITGRHVGVTDAMKDYARDKVEKLERIYGRMTKVDVTLDAHPDRKVAEIVAHANRGVQLVGRAESPDMYAAVDLAEEKLARQLLRHKERLTDHHREELPGHPRPAAGGAQATEETYEDVIDRLAEDGESKGK
ncbi:MAG TPA: ribosome-associated translation inhibitor RaiA [Planctomycetota bacterium]|nr:ribosome-associated translation inhibitor RaiA [Planctomycetota bacterium]